MTADTGTILPEIDSLLEVPDDQEPQMIPPFDDCVDGLSTEQLQMLGVEEYSEEYSGETVNPPNAWITLMRRGLVDTTSGYLVDSDILDEWVNMNRLISGTEHETQEIPDDN
jgi:hypothetical protein